MLYIAPQKKILHYHFIKNTYFLFQPNGEEYLKTVKVRVHPAIYRAIVNDFFVIFCHIN
jgi:hypothetical protein